MNICRKVTRQLLKCIPLNFDCNSCIWLEGEDTEPTEGFFAGTGGFCLEPIASATSEFDSFLGTGGLGFADRCVGLDGGGGADEPDSGRERVGGGVGTVLEARFGRDVDGVGGGLTVFSWLSFLGTGGGGCIFEMSGSSNFLGCSVDSELTLEGSSGLVPVLEGDTIDDEEDGDAIAGTFWYALIFARCCDSSFSFCILILISRSFSILRCSSSVLCALGGGGPNLDRSKSINECLNFGSSTGGRAFFFFGAAGSCASGRYT
ncbi:hypothetical protein OGATHE_003199 [Ogataea polymorpha]|uniref:Uncharacterized protein n=1 Tax=Ogataea polymorpha TaxID=460523 RepID=A0A9P8P9L7_9ASCO|nr:hypothetical protein OGATHE_003199 [Ogataea polymorpha]